MLNKKRGDISLERLALMIGLIASAFVVILVIGIGAAQASEKGPENVCRASMVTRTATSFDINGVDIDWGPLACETIVKEISGSRVEIKSQVAQAMERCWWMFNEGRQDDIFDSEQLSKLFGWDNNGNKCFICYTLAVKQDEIEDGPITAKEMFDYLKKTNHLKIKDKTYLDYIQSHGGPGKVAIMDTIYPENVYGVGFLSKSKDNAVFGVVDKVAAGILTTVAAVGIVACIIAEPCGVAAVAGALGTSGVVAGTASAGYLASHSAEVLLAKTNFYKEERAVSMIVLDDLKGIQEAGRCLSVEDLG
jgi:hypothetical protein